jgi:hypothetical protein
VFVALIPVVPIVLDNMRFTRAKFQASLCVFVGLLLFIVVIYPYLWDNYLLGATFQIQGKGVLSRWISHEIQSETIGQGVNLTPWGRRFWWLSSLPGLISLPFLVYSPLGLGDLLKKKMFSQLAMLLPWIAYASGFTIFFSYIEARYLIPAVPAFAILSAAGLMKFLDWIKSKSSNLRVNLTHLHILEAGIAAVSVLAANVLLTDLVLPTKVGSLAVLDLAMRAYLGNEGWFSSYSAALAGKLLPPRLNLDLAYVIDSLLCLAIVVVLPIRMLRTDILEEKTAATASVKSLLMNISILLAALGATTFMILNYFSTQVQTYAIILLLLVLVYILVVIVINKKWQRQRT